MNQAASMAALIDTESGLRPKRWGIMGPQDTGEQCRVGGQLRILATANTLGSSGSKPLQIEEVVPNWRLRSGSLTGGPFPKSLPLSSSPRLHGGVGRKR